MVSEPTRWTCRIHRRATLGRTVARTFVALFLLAVLASVWGVALRLIWGLF